MHAMVCPPPLLQPCFTYVMPAYRLGSVRSLLDDICNRCGCSCGASVGV